MQPRPLTHLSLTLTSALAALLANHSAQAASGIWIADANGLWSDTANWSGGMIADGSGSSGSFSTLNPSADRTVSLDTARTLSGLTFGDTDPSSAAGWLVNNNGNAANILTLGTTPTITVTALGAGKGAEISASLAGSAGLSKLGVGTLTLSGPNNYTGTTTIYGAGTLKLNGASGSLASSTGLFLGKNSDYTGGGSLIYDNLGASAATSQTLASLASQVSTPNDNTVQLTRSAAQPVSLTFTAVTTSNTENGNVINFVTKDSAGGGVNGSDYKIVLADQTAYRITKQNAYFNGGDFAVYDTSAGTGLSGFVRGINYGVDPNSASSAGGESFTATYNQEITGSISAQPGVTLGAANNNGTLKIVGSSDLTMTSGTLAFSGTGNTGAGGILKTGGGTSTLSGGSINLSAVGQGDIRVDGATDVLNIAMPLTFNAATRLLKSGAGTLILSGSNTYSTTDARNRFFINGGTLEIGGNATLNDTLGQLYLAPGASFKYNSGSLTSSVGTAINGSGSVAVNAGTLTLSGVNTYTGTTTVSGGTLTLGNATNTIANTSPVFVSGGTLNMANSDTVGLVSLSSGTISGAGTLTGSAYALTNSGNVSANLGSSAASLTKTGAGTATLTGTNSYTGATTISDGTLVIAGAGSINASSGVTLNGGALRYNSSVAYSGTLTFTSGTLGGTNLGGTLGDLTVGGGQSLSPGNSPGTAATTGQTWAPGGTYLWEINDATGTAGADPGWDLETGSATLTITATTEAKFHIDLTSLAIGNVAGDAANFVSTNNYNWLMADFAAITGFDATKFSVIDHFTNDTTGGTFGVALGGSGWVPGDSTQIYLTYLVPEPNAPLLCGLGLLALLRRRRSGVSAAAGRPVFHREAHALESSNILSK
jgi:autotransporter-associated beta strand protein